MGVNPPHPPRTGFLASFLILYILYGENLSSGFCEQQGTDQPAHTRSLISAFVLTGTVAEQAGLNLTLSEDRVSHAHIYFNVRGPKVVTLTHLSDCPGLETLSG